MQSRTGILLGAMILLAPYYALAEYEGAIFGVNDYDNGGSLCCSGCDDLAYPRGNAEAVRDALLDIGYAQVKLNLDGQVDGRDWVDEPTQSWGKDHVDPYGTDFADVIFYNGHGQRHCESGPYYSKIYMGDKNDGEVCGPRTDLHMRFGNGGDNEEANVLLVLACKSMHYCVWKHHGYDAMFNGGFNTYNGFHGITTFYWGQQGDLEDYVVDAKYNGIGDDWVDSFTGRVYWVLGPYRCATSMITGSSSSARNNQYSNGGFLDFKDTGSQTGSSYYFVCGCDPDDGEKLPDC